MKNRNLRRFSALFLVGAIGYWVTHPEGEFAGGPKASLKSEVVEVKSNFRPMSASVKKIAKADIASHIISTRKFQSKTRNLLKLEKINDIITQKLQIEGLLRRNPKLAKKIPEFVRSSSGKLRPKLAMIHSLAEVENKEAVAALLSIVRSDKFETTLRMQAIVSSRELTQPSEQVINELWKLSENRPKDATSEYALDGVALLSLGSIASDLPSERAEEIFNRINAKLEKAEAEGDQRAVEYLDALGNSGNPKVFEIADRYILSPLPEERAMAASILRKVADPKANQMLLEILDTDEASVVRNETIQVISNRKFAPDESARLAELMLEEPDSGIRMQMIKYFKDRIGIDPNAKDYLAKLLPLEEDENNSSQIRSAIGMG